MLKFLTHKLRTHSLNEENVSEKVGLPQSRLEFAGTKRREGHTVEKMAASIRSMRTKELKFAGSPRLG